MINTARVGTFCFCMLAAAICAGQNNVVSKSGKINLSSPAFGEGQPIPAQYTCDGDKSSPPLQWSAGPAGTQSFALICDDPDAPAGTWVHWVVYNIPATATELPEKAGAAGAQPGGGAQGVNSFKQTEYGPPCPPPGKAHRYYFKIYALDEKLVLKPGATKQDVLRAMSRHILATGQLMGTYQRK